MFKYPSAQLKKTAGVFAFTALISVLLPPKLQSQQNQINSNSHLAEKIYLQTDSKVYTTDRTIWFKCIVANADDHSPSSLSGVLYVELISPGEKVIEKKLIKLENGIGNGFFDLNKDYSGGQYLLRAYTEWDKNFGSDFFFREYIQVFDPSAKVKPDPVSNVTIVEKQDNKRQLIASFSPLLIDSLHKKELTLIVTIDDRRDTLSVRKNDDDKYVIDYPVPEKCQFVTFQMLTKNLISYTKTIVIDEHRLDLQFFPESGELVDGLTSKVGFKALDYNGKGTSISGEIINDRDEVISAFRSNRAGMGSFILTNADKGRSYFARLKSQPDSAVAELYPLPKVAPRGNVLSVNWNGDEIHMEAASNYLKNDTVNIRVSCRGVVYFDVKGRLKDGSLGFSLPVNKLPDGIIAITLMDSNMLPVAERLYFNDREQSRLNIDISRDRNSYSRRDLTTLNILTTDNYGKPVSSSLSLLVLNKEQMGQIQSQRQNILSYFLLSSDLKGEIENPGAYFRKDASQDDLDALMLTQGWRRYLYDKPVDSLPFRPEARLNVTGKVGGLLFEKTRKEAELTMMTFGRRRSAQSLTTDSLGKFHFDINDEYGQNLNILIQSSNRAGRNRNYTIALDKKTSPPVTFDHNISVEKADSVVQYLVEKNIERKKVDETFKLTSGDILLPEVVVEAYRMTPVRKKVMEEYGKPKEVISGEAIQQKEEKWSFGLYSVLMTKYPNKFNFFRLPDGEVLVEARKSVPTCIVVDGITVNTDNYNLIPFIPPSEVSSFEVITDVKNRSKVWFEFCPDCSPLSIPPIVDVIAIYTYGGKGIFGYGKTKGILTAAVPVFSTPREFYRPKYDNLQAIDWYKPDLRALINWEPMLMTDSLGKVSASFYNADIPGEMEVVVEAISGNGDIGYKEVTYTVRKRN